MTSPALFIDGLSLEYQRRGVVHRAVDRVSLEIERGKTLGLVGESGCGKSSVALAITRMLPRANARIVSGTISVGGRDVMTLGAAELRKLRALEVGSIPQDPLSALNPLMRVGAQVGEVLKLTGVNDRRERHRRSVEALERVGIPSAIERLRAYPHEFSGGMRQRVAIAMAVASEPQLLIADEPTTALDVTTQAQILELIRELTRDSGMSTLLITHDLGVAAGMCDEIAVMYAGQIVERAPAAEFFALPQMPYGRGLLNASPARDVGSGGRMCAIPGAPPTIEELNRPGCRFAPRCAHRREVCVDTAPPLTARGHSGHLARCWGTENGGWIT